MKKIVLYISLFVLFSSAPGMLSAEDLHYFPSTSSRLDIPENYQVRNKYKDIIFSSLWRSRNAKERIHIQNNFPQRVQFQLVEKDNALFFLFLNEQEGGRFPMIGRGNVSVKRSLEDGSIQLMTIIFRNNNSCYIRLTPHDERSRLDLYLFGSRVYHNIFIPLPLKTLAFEPFRTIIESTKTIINWDVMLFTSMTREFSDGLDVFTRIRTLLPQLNTVADGAQSASGRYVFIKDTSVQPEPGGLNCSGFAKWIIDGFYHSIKGEYTDVNILKQKHPELRGNRWSQWFEDERDPFFGLDWTRNLAVALYKARTGKDSIDPESFDVRELLFLEYIEDVGYPAADLELLLFLLARENPHCFYLGSVNQAIGREPVLRQHFHIALFFPYFNSRGEFQVIVMEKNKEIDLDFFMSEYGNNYIHLVKIEIEGEFHPPLP